MNSPRMEGPSVEARKFVGLALKVAGKETFMLPNLAWGGYDGGG